MNIRKFNNKPNIVLIQGSPRSVDNCPNENSKTSAIVQHIYQKYEHIANFEIIDLSLQQNKNIIKPCKACISTAGGFHCSFPCLPSSERVQTEFGYDNINNLKENDILSTGKVLKQWMTSPLEDVYEIILNDGRKLRLTNNHKIKILSKEKFRNKESNWTFFREELWKELKDIKIGDIVPPIPLGGKFSEKTKFIDEYFLLAGLFWGDGTIAGKDSLWIYYDNRTEHDFGESIKENLDFYVSDLDHKVKNNMQNDGQYKSKMKKINYGSQIGRKIQYEMGFKKVKASDRRLPKILFNCSEKELCLFFNGWFSTDGSVGKEIISLYNASYDCLRDAQILLAKIGIKSSVKNNEHLKIIVRGKEISRVSHLFIGGHKNLIIFKDKINFINQKKSMKLDILTQRIKKKMNDKPTKVKSITYVGKEPVYDIMVEKSHEFVAEGILVHNCSCYSKETEDLMYDLDVYPKLQKCDAFLVFTPIHWYSVTSQVKAMFDRLVCINLTMTTDEAKEFYGDNMKNREYSAYAEQSGKYDHLLKNHLEGKICGFFAHGDNGGTDYNDMEKPESLREKTIEEKEFSKNPNAFLLPFVYQMRYSGVKVPDELVKAVYINTKVDYATSNDIFPYDYIAHHEAEVLFQNLMDML